MLPEIENLVMTYILPPKYLVELQLAFSLVNHFCLHCQKRGLCFLSMVKHDNFKKMLKIVLTLRGCGNSSGGSASLKHQKIA